MAREPKWLWWNYTAERIGPGTKRIVPIVVPTMVNGARDDGADLLQRSVEHFYGKTN
jgi:hypothetical protein